MFAINRNACTVLDDGALVIEASTACLPPGHWPAVVGVDDRAFPLDHFELDAGEEIVAARYVDPRTGNAVCIIND